MIVVMGYYGSNLGDVMMLRALLMQLRRSGQHVRVASHGKPDLPDFFEYCSLERGDFLSLGSLSGLRKIRSFIQFTRGASAVVWGGGTCFMDEEGGEGGIKLMMLARLLGKRVGYVSVGIGRCRTLRTRMLVSVAFLISSHFSVRDDNSLHTFAKLIPHLSWRMPTRSADLVYLLDEEIRSKPADEHWMCVSLRDLTEYVDSRTAEEVYGKCLDVVAEHCRAEGIRYVRVISCDSAVDGPVSRELVELLQGRGLDAVLVEPSIANNLDCIFGAEAVCTSRLHVVMVSLIAKRPVFPVDYSPKVAALLESFSLGGRGANIADLAGGVRLDLVLADRMDMIPRCRALAEADVRHLVEGVA